ncbi:MAG: hypothetical protein ACLKAO_12940 [Alkaliphilus sp.]
MLFNAFRYFIVPTSTQIHIQHLQSSKEYPISNKEQLIKDILTKLKTEIKLTIEHKKKKYLFYHIAQRRERYLLLKLAKEKERELHVEGAFDIENETMQDYPYVYIMLDTTKQIILMQHMKSIFNSTSMGTDIFSYFLNQRTSEYDYEVSINPMLLRDSFWLSIDGLDSIHEVEFTLEAPNLFDGFLNIDDFLKRVKEKYNNTRTTTKLVNNTESLILAKDNIEL